MSHDNDRDASLERLLSRSAAPPSRAESSGLRRASPPRFDECLDAETLAAWAEGSLQGAERTAAERHAADCAHCQAMLAAMVRTEPAPPVRAGGWARAITLRWALPLTAGIALAIWLLAPLDDRGIRPDTVAEAPAPPVADSAARQVPPAATPAPQRSEGGQSGDRAPASPTPSARDQVARQQPRSRSTRTGDEDAGAASSAAIPAPAEAARADAPRAERRSDAAPPSGALAKTATLGAKEVAPPAFVEAVSPDTAIHWRVGAAGLVQRSIDGGATWQTQSSGVPADLLAASAPSATVCWAVGRAGSVVVTTDGRTWRRLTFPETADLVRVVATSGSAADVTTADGRTFHTADGGTTWIAH